MYKVEIEETENKKLTVVLEDWLTSNIHKHTSDKKILVASQVIIGAEKTRHIITIKNVA